MTTKPKLSKGILDMKFMKRSKEQSIIEDEEAEGRAMYSNEITKKMLSNNNSNFIIEHSFVHCENLIDGRLSFLGMNPEIERLMELENQEKEAKKNGEMTKDVDDKEMAKAYHLNTISKSNNRKFAKNKREKLDESEIKSNKKRKFIRPHDDE